LTNIISLSKCNTQLYNDAHSRFGLKFLPRFDINDRGCRIKKIDVRCILQFHPKLSFRGHAEQMIRIELNVLKNISDLMIRESNSEEKQTEDDLEHTLGFIQHIISNNARISKLFLSTTDDYLDDEIVEFIVCMNWMRCDTLR
jgi:hypothetical protein